MARTGRLGAAVIVAAASSSASGESAGASEPATPSSDSSATAAAASPSTDSPNAEPPSSKRAPRRKRAAPAGERSNSAKRSKRDTAPENEPGDSPEAEPQPAGRSIVATRRRKAEKDPSEMTVWDLVMKNKRVVSQEEKDELRREKVKKAEAEEAERQRTFERNISAFRSGGMSGMCVRGAGAGAVGDGSGTMEFGSLDDLISGMEGAGGDGPAAAGGLDGLFGPSEGRSSNSDLFDGDLFGSQKTQNGPSLQMDESGNLRIVEDTGYDSYRGDSGLNETDLFEGRSVVMENCFEHAPVTPFDGAYKYTRPTKWPEEDETIFYTAIEMFGLDLMMVQSFLPKYSEKQIKRKFATEDRRRDGRMDAALRRRRPVSLDLFRAIYGEIDPSTHYRPALPSDDEDDYLAGASSSRGSLKNGGSGSPSASVFGLFDEDLFSQDAGVFGPTGDQEDAGGGEFDLAHLMGSGGAMSAYQQESSSMASTSVAALLGL